LKIVEKEEGFPALLVVETSRKLVETLQKLTKTQFFSQKTLPFLHDKSTNNKTIAFLTFLFSQKRL
jgi:hypothetical protein